MSLARRLVVFDMDGTLVDSQRQILASMAGAFAGVGLPLPPEAAVLGIVGLSLPQAMARLVPDLSAATLDALVAGYKDTFVQMRMAGDEATSAPLYPGALVALDALAARADVVLAVATGKSRRGLDHVLAGHDLARFFVTTQVADDHPSKPHPAMLEAALRATGVAARDAVMVGDTDFDMLMGQAAGVRRLGVSWGYQPAARLRAAGAERLIDGFAELLPALDAFWDEPA